jgi:hypothetical protein
MLADAISKMDALTKRMDALETGEGHKNPIKGDDDRSKRKDDATKSKADDDDDDDDAKDDATTPKSKILADAKGASEKDDAASVSDASDSVKGDAKKKADAAKKGDDGELEIKHKGEEKGDSKKKSDSKKADAKAKSDDDDDAKDDDDDDDKKSDDDDDDKKDDAAKKADSVGILRRQISDQAAVIARLERMMKPKTDDEHAAFADAQARADSVYQGFGKHAPRPLEGEGLMDYRKRLATNLKMHSSMWKNVKLSKLDEEAFEPIETQIYADASSAAANPLDLEAGELRMVTKIDPTTGVRSNLFYGKESFVKQMGRPGRRVASFRTMGSV